MGELGAMRVDVATYLVVLTPASSFMSSFCTLGWLGLNTEGIFALVGPTREVDWTVLVCC